jgi:small subunit ribosomal protein S7
MPRKGPAPKRPLDVDPVFGSQLVTQLVSKVLKDGKKQVAQRMSTPRSRAAARRPAPTPW